MNKKARIMQILLIFILFLSIYPVKLLGENSYTEDFFVIELQEVIIHQYATFNVLLVMNPISIKDMSALTDNYDYDKKVLRKLRDFLVQKSREKESPIIDIIPKTGRVDKIEIILNDGSTIYYDGIILERIIKHDLYIFETIDWIPYLNDQKSMDKRITPPLQEDSIQLIKEFLNQQLETGGYQNRLDLEKENINHYWIYTIVTANNLIIKTEEKNLKDILDYHHLLRENWIYNVGFKGKVYKKVRIDSNHLHFFNKKIEFICFNNPEKSYESVFIYKIPKSYEIRRILDQIEKDLMDFEKKRNNIISNDYSLEKFTENYHDAMNKFLSMSTFLEKSSAFYDMYFNEIIEFGGGNYLLSIGFKCEEYLSKISILENDFDLLKRVYLLEADNQLLAANNQSLEKTNELITISIWTLRMAIFTLLFAIVSLIISNGSSLKSTIISIEKFLKSSQRKKESEKDG